MPLADTHPAQGESTCKEQTYFGPQIYDYGYGQTPMTPSGNLLVVNYYKRSQEEQPCSTFRTLLLVVTLQTYIPLQ